MYQYFKRELKIPTCFGSFVIHPQGVLNVLDWNYLWYFCVRSRCSSNFGTVPYKFDITFQITVQISRCQTPTTPTKHHK